MTDTDQIAVAMIEAMSAYSLEHFQRLQDENRMLLEALEDVESACAEYVKSGFSGFAFAALTRAREQARKAIAKATSA